MATLVEGGSDLFDALAYTMPQPGVYDFLAHRAQNYSNLLTSSGSQFLQNVKSYYDAITESEAMRIARAAMRKVENIWNADTIRYINDVQHMQAAGLQMQRWIMAEPTIRQMYIRQECEGYGDAYVDQDPGLVGERHYDYRRVMNGIVVEQDEGWYASTFIEDLRPGDRELMLDEQADILHTWENVRAAIRHRKQDPTSRFGGTF